MIALSWTLFALLALFWTGIIGLIVILRMKLRETERVQRIDRDRDRTAEPPLLD